MKSDTLLDALAGAPVIASVKTEDDLEAALKSDVGVIFLLFGNILTVGELIRRVRDTGKLVFVHLDLIEGLSPREVTVDFIAQSTGADGIISTKAALTRRARELGLLAIRRFFLLDSMALSNIEHSFHPDASDVIEVLPGLMPSIIRWVAQVTGQPVIAGGLIRYKEDVTAALSAGAVAVSTTNPNVWEM